MKEGVNDSGDKFRNVTILWQINVNPVIESTSRQGNHVHIAGEKV